MKTEVKDVGDLRRYRTEIPNLIDDADLSVYAFRLYVHLKRVAGETGVCWQGTRTLAAACKMSLGKVSDAKAELVEAKFIYITPGEGDSSDQITIADLWRENMETYFHAEEGCSPHERVHHMNTPVHHMNGSVHHMNERSNPEEETQEEVGSRASARSPDIKEKVEALKTNPAYRGIDVDREAGKMRAWCEAHGKQPTYRRLVAWLNRIDNLAPPEPPPKPPPKVGRIEACRDCDSNGQREVTQDGKRFMVRCAHEGLENGRLQRPTT